VTRRIPFVAAAPATRTTALQVGAVVPELLDPSLQETTVALMERAGLADTAQVTITWERKQTVIDPGLLSDRLQGKAKAFTAISPVFG
jgi:hypothetical protein